VSVRTGLGWLKIGIGGGRLWVRRGTFGLHKTRGISWLAANQLASQEGLCSMELSKYVLRLTQLYNILLLFYYWLLVSAPNGPHQGSQYTQKALIRPANIHKRT
jgi:hypothetical protein